MMDLELIDNYLQYVTLQNDCESDGSERDALVEVSPRGFFIRAPPKPHQLTTFTTEEANLFQAIHMGSAIVDSNTWKLTIDGLVQRPLSIYWSQLQLLPKVSVVAFHECYGSPVKPPNTNLWRIGNVTWSGVPLDMLIRLADPLPEAQYVWSDGLENGSFGEARDCDRYQKDLPLFKASSPGCLVAYEMNGAPLGKERGGPVRLIVPGFYGTNSTKWLCRLSLQNARSLSPFTTLYYNEIDPTDHTGIRKRPCWEVEPNSFLSMLPSSHGKIQGPDVMIEGRAWGCLAIKEVVISILTDACQWTLLATVKPMPRSQYEWQHFESVQIFQPGVHQLMVQATDMADNTQPITDRRNHAHKVIVEVM